MGDLVDHDAANSLERDEGVGTAVAGSPPADFASPVPRSYKRPHLVDTRRILSTDEIGRTRSI